MTPPPAPGRSTAGYQFRNFTLSDYEAVMTVWRGCEGIGLNESDTPEGLARFLDRNPGLSVVAESPGIGIVGTLLCGHDGRRGYLHHLAVLPAHRRQGLGQRMVETCLARLRALGIAKCNLFLYATNRTGRAFWERHGWHAREDLVVVQRTLSDGARESGGNHDRP